MSNEPVRCLARSLGHASGSASSRARRFVAAGSPLCLLGQTSPVPPTPRGEGLEVTLVHSWSCPPWLTLLLLLLAAVFVLFLYLHEAGETRRSIRGTLAAIRLTLILLVIVMMYGWMRQSHRTDLPDLVFVLDDSQSMGFSDQYDDPRWTRRLRDRVQAASLDVPSRINLAKSLLLNPRHGWLDQLRSEYNVSLYLLGATARVQGGADTPLDQRVRTASADQPASRLGDGLQSILEAQRGRPTAAIVVLSDGITTEGKSIAEVAHYARRKQIPLFLIGVGDQRPPRDLRLSDLLVDQVVFLGDAVNFDCKLSGTGFDRASVAVRLTRAGDDTVLAEQKFELVGDGTVQDVRLVIRPQEEGEFEYVVRVEPLRNETTVENNQLAQVVRVRDETIRVLYVQEYPSMEFRFLKTLLEREVKRGADGKSFQLATILQEADQEYTELDETAIRSFPVTREELFEYDVVIFGDVNPAFMSRPVLENLTAFVTERGGGIVFIAGPRHTPLAYRDTPLESLLPIDLNTARLPDETRLTDDVLPVALTRLGLISPQLQLADTPDENARLWSELPPLRWILAVPDKRPAAHVLVETPAAGPDAPRSVIVSQLVGAGHVIFHATDESYLWSRLRGSDRYYERYWLQTLRYLSRARLLGGDRSVEIVADRNQYDRGDSVPLQVRFFDERTAPAADDGVAVLLERPGGRRQKIQLHRDTLRRGVFGGTISGLAEGSYRVWLATPTLEGDPPAWQFSVVPPPGEHAQLMMDEEGLLLAAQTSEGRLYTLQNADRLPHDLPRGRQVRIESLPPEPVWNSPFLVGLFVVLLVAEWLGRKWVGWL